VQGFKDYDFQDGQLHPLNSWSNIASPTMCILARKHGKRFSECRA